MGKRHQTKKYAIYEPYTTYGLLMYLILFSALIIALSCFFVWKFLIVQYTQGVFLLLLILWVPWVFVTIGLFRDGLMKRLLIRLMISREGICWSCFGHKKHIITWDCIHTFGIIGYSVAYVSRTLLLFSVDPKERAAKNITEANRISENRIVIQFRPDVWMELLQHMPEDMQAKLSYAISRKEDCFHKR